MAQTRKQRAASIRNLRKARAARGSRRRRRVGRGRRRARRTRTRRRRRLSSNPVAKSAAGRRRQRAASRRNIKKAIRARRRNIRGRRRIGAIRKAAGRGGIRLVRVRQASTPIVITEKPRRRKRAALLENPRRRRKRRKGRRRRRGYSANSLMLQNEGMRFRRSRDMLQNPYDNIMLENQVFSLSAIRAFGLAGLGVGIGLTGADAADRIVATRKPTGGQNPYYGANAAAAQNRRPDAWRLGAQAAGGVAGVALAYAVRRMAILPWLVGGTAVGFFANLTKMLVVWYGMPYVLKVKAGNEASLANRMYALEQNTIQDAVDTLFKNWQTTTNLNNNQLPAPNTAIAAIIPVPTGPAYVLGRKGNGATAGKAQAQSAEASGRVGQPFIVPTGLLGSCPSCGGDGGCWNHCSDLTLCGDCPDTVARRCEYNLQPGDNIPQMAALYGIDMRQVDELNPAGYGTVGGRVVLPYAFCRALERAPARVAGAPGNGASASRPNIPVSSPAVLPFGLAANPEE